ncbi:MAG: flagellar motor protein MotB [Rhodomicrobium sp.]
MLKNKKGKESQHYNIIVKKRSSGGEDCHHGGVWKIAYADFMTAMMTFFLVMWLINSSSKEKITQLASYFNPVKLSDRTAPAKGVRENQSSGAQEQNAATTKSGKKPPKPGASPADAQHSAEEEMLFRNPFAVLTQLASQAEGSLAAAMTGTNSSSLVSRSLSHDPFQTDPVVDQPLRPSKSASGSQAGAGALPQPAATTQLPPVQEEKPAIAKPQPVAAEKTENAASPESEATAGRLRKELAKLIAELPESFRPKAAVQATQEGVLISITDDLNFNMFKIASAEPSPQLVLVLDRVGQLISKNPGKFIVRGHTDGRPYAGDNYGNWRLSLNRANMAYFMLLRGKVDEKQFLAVEGYADRSLRNKADPLAGENRRIEILIKGPEK